MKKISARYAILILAGLALGLPPVVVLGGEAAVSRQIVSLARHDSKKIEGDGGLLLREIYRQAFLLAARDELGCLTRDAVLRETLAAEPFRLALVIHPTKEVSITLHRSPKKSAIQKGADKPVATTARDQGKALLDKTFPLLGAVDNLDYRPSIQLAEKLSRGAFVTILKSKGIKRVSLPRNVAASPKWLNKFIDSFEPIFLYLAVRKLHELRWRDGETPHLTALLARTYANLGTATDYVLNASPKVFRARALLYAARAVNIAPDDIECQLTRAYVFSVIGMPNHALPIFAKYTNELAADKKFPWAIHAQQLAQHKTAELRKYTKSKRAQYFAFLSAEFGGTHDQLIAHAKTALEYLPDSYRILDRLAHTGGISSRHRGTVSGHQVFARQFRAKLKFARVLKDSLSPLLATAPSFRQQPAEARNRAAITKTLIDAGATDTKEFSWEILGRLAEETSFVMVLRRIVFMRFSWSVDIAEPLAKYAPIYSAHPYGKILPFLQRSVMQSNKKKRQKALVGVSIVDSEDKMSAIIYRIKNTYPGVDLWAEAWLHADPIRFDFGTRMNIWGGSRSRRLLAARTLLKVDPEGVFAPTKLLLWSPQMAAEHLDKWQAHFADDPNFRHRLAGYYRDRDPEKALKIYAALVRDNPGSFLYVRDLASFYKKNEDREKWRKTLEAHLKQPDNGLTHANIRNQIANDYIQHMEYKKALPYAEQAAQTWAAWAMLTAAKANEWVGDYKRAELWVRRTSERYSGSRNNWFFWCQRTGKGDLAAATTFYQSHVLKVGEKSRDMRRVWPSSDFFLLAGNYKAAIGFCRQQVELEPTRAYHRMYLAFLCSLDKDVDERDAQLQVLIDTFGKRGGHKDRGYYEIAKQVRAWLSGKAEVTPKTIHAALAEKGLTLDPRGRFFVGIFAYQAGHPDRARADLLATAENGDRYYHPLTAYAWKVLREMKLDPVALINKRKRIELGKETELKGEDAEGEGEEIF